MQILFNVSRFFFEEEKAWQKEASPVGYIPAPAAPPGLAFSLLKRKKLGKKKRILLILLQLPRLLRAWLPPYSSEKKKLGKKSASFYFSPAPAALPCLAFSLFFGEENSLAKRSSSFYFSPAPAAPPKRKETARRLPAISSILSIASQTSSSTTTGAASPRRAPSLYMRV